MPVRRLPPELAPYEISVPPPLSAPVADADWRGLARRQPWITEPEGVPWGPYFDAIRRHIMLIACLAAACSALGIFAATRVQPVHKAQSTIWINSPGATQSGPLRA